MAYKTPGVFIEEIAKLPPSVAEVETAIPAFIGYTQLQGKTGKPIQTVGSGPDQAKIEVARISSLVEYETYFGTALPTEIDVTITEAADGSRSFTSAVLRDGVAPVNTMYYQLQMFFANGGGPCYIVSVNKANGTVALSHLMAGIDAIGNYDEPTLLVIPETVSIQTLNNGEPDPFLGAGDAYSLYTHALLQCATLKDRFVIMDCYPDTAVGGDDIGLFRGQSPSSNLKYGAAYYPNLKTTLNYVISDDSVNVTIARTTGDVDGTLADFATTDTSAYNMAKQGANSVVVVLPPSAAVAGVYAAVDSSRGVWKAPANVGLNYVSGPTVILSDEDQKDMNVDVAAGKSINAIRFFTGKGTLVWGARTLAGNDNEWRYISVRRFFNMVEESVKKATGGFVFEPNDANTWTKVQGMIENYLFTLWRAGALQGAKPEHAYYVAVGLNNTMTAQDILEGRMNIEIGMAAVRPAEFIILRFSHLLAQS